jgi:RNAse (barnase) inhibitor barstar
MSIAALATHIQGNHGGVWFLADHADPKAVQAQAKKAGFAFFHLEGRNVARKDQLLKHLAAALRFPEDFGHNWDALEECLTDLEWIDSKGYVLYHDHIDPLLSGNADQFETLLEILQDAVDSWKEDGTAFIVLLSGTKAPKGVPKLGAPEKE